jgi:hypothetical protein
MEKDKKIENGEWGMGNGKREKDWKIGRLEDCRLKR